MRLRVTHVIAALLLAVAPFSASAASLMEKFTPGTAYYFDSFDSEPQPWEPGQHLNIEEVFKNYQYYEMVLDHDGKGMTVNQYIQGIKKSSEKYLILPDGSLRKKM